AGVQDIILRVSDGRGGVALQSFRVATDFAGSAPVITTPAPTAPGVVGLPYRYRFAAQDADGDVVTFRLPVAPPGMSIDPATGVLSWTPTAAQLGTQSVTLAVTDGQFTTTLPFTLPVVTTDANDPPVISSTPRTAIRLGDRYLYQVSATD